MMRHYIRYVTAGLAALVALPGVAYAQEDCVEGGNSATRSAEVEFALAASRDDTRSQEDRYKRALDKLEKNWEMDRIPSRSYLLAANAYLGLRDFAGADSMLTMLVDVESGCAEQVGAIRFNSWVGQYNAGIEQMQVGDEDLALTRFESANLINRDARSLAYAGSIYQRRGDDELAAERYIAALDAGGDDAIVRTASINLAALRKAAGDTEGALAIYSEYSASNPNDILGQLNFAIALMDADRQGEAQAIFEELIGRDDLSFPQWSQVGIGLYRAQNFDPAAVAFSKALELSPYNKETLENLANSYYQSERFEDLRPLARRLTEEYPLERVNYNLLANARRELGDPDAALAAIQGRDGMSFEFLGARMSPISETTYSIEGQVMNRNGTPGSTHSITVTFLDETGAELFAEPLELTLPAEQEIAAFALQVESEVLIAGFRYEAPGS